MRLLQFASMNARSFSDSENEDVFGTPWFTFSLTHGCHFVESVSRFFLKVVAVSRRALALALDATAPCNLTIDVPQATHPPKTNSPVSPAPPSFLWSPGGTNFKDDSC